MADKIDVEMTGVTEYCEGLPVRLTQTEGDWRDNVTCRSPPDQQPGYGRLVVAALNEAGHNGTEVDLLELLTWLKDNRPDLL